MASIDTEALWDLIGKWRDAAVAHEDGPYLSRDPVTAWGQGIHEAAEDLSDLILDSEESG